MAIIVSRIGIYILPSVVKYCTSFLSIISHLINLLINARSARWRLHRVPLHCGSGRAGERSPMSQGSISVITTVSLPTAQNSLSALSDYLAFGLDPGDALLLAPAPPQQGLREDVEVRLCLKERH